MIYENKVIVFPMGAKINSRQKHHFEYCTFSMANRRKTLKIGNAIRLRKFNEDCEFYDCKIVMEGTMTVEKIEPYAKHKCFIYVKGYFGLELDNAMVK